MFGAINNKIQGIFEEGNSADPSQDPPDFSEVQHIFPRLHNGLHKTLALDSQCFNATPSHDP
jgi:hypothetical protein